jgi:SPOR domain
VTTTETETPSASPTPPDEPPVATSCPRCGAPMRPDQDWCLNCGAAVTTEVSGARGWRTPIAIVGALLTIAAVALVIAFVKLSDDNKQVAQNPAATPTPAAVAPAPTPSVAPPAGTGATPAPGDGTTPGATPAPGDGTTATPTPGAGGETPGETPPAGGTGETPGTGSGTGSFAGWPAGTTAYTVILWSATSRKEAENKATALQAAGASSLGILHSNDFSSLRSGYWVVFSGQYDSNDEAQSAAQSAQATSPGAYAKQVKPG